MQRHDTQEDRWREIYLILFPEVDSGKIPSPCKLCRDDHCPLATVTVVPILLQTTNTTTIRKARPPINDSRSNQ